MICCLKSLILQSLERKFRHSGGFLTACRVRSRRNASSLCGTTRGSKDFISGDLDAEDFDAGMAEGRDDAEGARLLKKIKRKKSSKDFPEEQRIDMLFGTNPVLLALKQKKRTFHELFVTEAKSISHDPLMKDILDTARLLKIPVREKDPSSLRKLSEQRPHQGVILACSALQPIALTSVLLDVLLAENQQRKLWLFLDTIYDPMNFGAILRSAYFFGVQSVFVIDGYGCPLTPIVSKASAGAMEVIPLYSLPVRDIREYCKRLKESGIGIISTASDNEAKTVGNKPIVSLNDIQVTKDNLLVFGNENRGVNPDLIAMSDQIATILPGSQQLVAEANCLNVSVSAGVFLYHFSRKGAAKEN